MKKEPYKQLVFDMTLSPAMDQKDFLIGKSNQDAFKIITSWPKWNQNALYLYGPPGSGKSHLSNIWASMTKACTSISRREKYNSIFQNINLNIPHAPQNIIINLDKIIRNEQPLAQNNEKLREVDAFHLINELKATNGFLLLTSRLSPSQQNFNIEDLNSRIKAMDTVQIGKPNDKLLKMVLIKLMADRQIILDNELAQYIITRIERSFNCILQLSLILDQLILAENRKLTKFQANKAISELIKPQNYQIN